MAKKTYTISPAGTVKFAHLATPDTKFDSEGVYSVKLVLTKENSAGLIEQIDQVAQESLAAATKDHAQKLATEKNPAKKKKLNEAKPFLADKPYSEAEEGDGQMQFSLKMKASGTAKDGTVFTQRPAVFDAKGKPLDAKTLKLGNGSVVKASFEVLPFYTVKVGAGATLRLRAVQIITLKEWGDVSGSYYGFGEEEGYTQDEFSSTGSDDGEGDETGDGETAGEEGAAAGDASDY